jgi:hypothetical protein
MTSLGESDKIELGRELDKELALCRREQVMRDYKGMMGDGR